MKIAILILTLSIGIYIVRAYKRSQAYLILQHYTKSPYEEKMELQRYVRKRNSHMPYGCMARDGPSRSITTMFWKNGKLLAR